MMGEVGAGGVAGQSQIKLLSANEIFAAANGSKGCTHCKRK